MIFFTSDSHFGHKNIIKYCQRPFDSVEEMDDRIIDNLNKTVQYKDTLYHLGDFAFGDIDNIKACRKRIKCRNIHLILGNHDRIIRKNQEHFNRVFSSISEFKEIKIDRQCITLCHYAMRVWNKSHYGSWNLFAHSHGQLPNIKNSIDVGVDCWDFQPLSFIEVKEILNLE